MAMDSHEARLLRAKLKAALTQIDKRWIPEDETERAETDLARIRSDILTAFNRLERYVKTHVEK